uniref:Cadherin EGF LAG seven-pass G-type receptor 2 n=1 Tax=Aceria tosichella TaxID=561515 RepID=A0A6G1S6M5_9ACAR
MIVDRNHNCHKVDGNKLLVASIQNSTKNEIIISNYLTDRPLALSRRTKILRQSGIIFYIISTLACTYSILNIVTSTNAKYGVQATSATTSSLSPDRVHIIRQPANLHSSTYKQVKQNYKEKFDKIVIHVKENTPIGTRLTEVQPKDVEVPSQAGSSISGRNPPQDQTLYALVGGADDLAFTLRKDVDGKVELVNEVNFDYESPKKIYHVAIRATSVYFRYELEVDVLVEDENDNKPQLDDFAIVFNNYKNHFPTGPIGRVPATDLDINDSLRYRVLTGNNAQLIIVNETTGDIQLSPWLNSNVPLKAVMDIAVSDGINDAVAKLVLTVNLVTEPMLHNSVMIRLDGITRDEFLSRKYDIFQNQMARILGTSSLYSTNNIVVFDVEESHHNVDPQQESSGALASPVAPVAASDNNVNSAFRTAYNQHSVVTNTSLFYVNVSFSARADGNDVEAYLSRQYIEERIFLHRLILSQNLEAQVAPFQDDICVQEPCLNYQECQVTYKFDKAPKTFYTNRNMIFRQIKTSQSYTCLCPDTFTGMKNKLECNLQINQCFTNPCLNGGQCHRHESGYTCECRGEFFGPRCEHSFINSTCQSLAATQSRNNLQGSSTNENLINSIDRDYPLIKQSTLAASVTCSGKSRCVNLNKSHQHYYQKLATSSSSISSASKGLTGGFACQGCPFQNQWSNDLCQLRARSFEKQSYIVLPSLKRRHRFHLMLQFNTFQTDALLLYNGRYNDKHDFIALEIVDSRLRFSYSLGQPGQVSSISLSSFPVSDGEWHKVAVDYRDRNVTLILDDCDPVLDDALARVQLGAPSRCSNTTVTNTNFATTTDQSLGAVYRMLDLTSPMQIGSIPPNLLNTLSVGSNDVPPAGAVSTQNNEQPSSSSARLASLANSFSGCISDLHVDHQLVDLGSPLEDFGTQPGCPERRNLCQPQSCNGFPCQDSYGSLKCQCSEERIGRSCELILSPGNVRKFSGNSYLAFNPVEAQIPNQWQISLHFRTLNPGILFKIFLDPEASIVLEVLNSGLKLTHRSHSLFFNKIPVDDGEWHMVELSWLTVGQDIAATTSTSLQVDYNQNLSVQSSEMGQVSGSTMRFVVVGSSSRLFTPGTYANGSPSSSTNQDAPPVPAGPEGSAEFSGGLLTGSTVSPTQATSVTAGGLVTSDDFTYGGTSNASSQSFVGCIFGLNMSDNAEWWQSPFDERNVERGCPAVDPCETKPCPSNSRCIRKGINHRKCLCNPGFIGELCLPVCDLQPCQGENSVCVAASSVQQNLSSTDSRNFLSLQQQPQYTCECEPNRSGKNCEHQLSQRCPSNWWGRPLSPGQNSSICGPCNCDESKGFDGDCDKLTGQCFCKPNHYQPPGSDYCFPCDCYSIGSLSTSCNQTSGQCKCRPGVVGRRCETCASQYAEVTLRGCEVTYDLACPKTYSDGIWWEKTQLDRTASQQCPVSTSTGTATRFCHKTDGWQKANLFDCISNTFTDLYTQYQFLEENKFQMTTNLAMKIASNLKLALNETISSPSMQLYGSDMYISFRLLHHLIQHESRQTGLNLTHRQDRAYIRNIAESISYILDPNYADNWPEIAARSPNGGAEYILKLLDNFGKILIDSQSDTYTQPFEIETKHLTFGMDTLSIDQLYDMNKWSLGTGLLSPSTTPFHQTTSGNHFPSSPPYATDPFESPFGPIPSSSKPNTITTDSSMSGHFNPDGTSVYLDFSATRDSSPSVVIPKYDNYPSTASESSDYNQQSKIFLPLKTLRMKQPREIIGGGSGGSTWGIAAARSRAKRDELIIPDYASMRNQRQPVVVYSIYKTLGPLLPGYYDNSVQNRLGNLAMANSPVVWLTVRPQNSSEFLGKNLRPPITYMLKMVEPVGKTRPQCAIWDFATASQPSNGPAIHKNVSSTSQMVSSSSGSSSVYGLKQTGRFSTRGCEIKGVHPNHRLRFKYEYVNCSCDHLGAVIVLMDNSNGYDSLTSDESGNFKEISLIVALALSLAVMTSTLFVLTCIRGHSIKSNSNSINKNLIVILIIIELLILYSTLMKGSLNQLEYQCKLVAIFLHYFSISLFFWLLVNAIHFYRMLTELRDINHGPMKFYHVLGYAVPAFFVSIAVGLRIEQFGNYLFCWLSIHEPIIWSMFGPISLVSMLTIILFKFALCKSLPLNKMMDNQEDPNGVDLIKTHMLINSIKTPLIGFYWLIAVYAVNESLVDYEFLFPLAILTKSIVLFALFCLVDKYIRYNLYVSWLRFKGEKVPFVDDSMITYGHYGLGAGGAGAAGTSTGSQQWMISMMNSMAQDGANAYTGLGGLDPKNQGPGQVLYPNQQQVLAPGFQSSCTDIFRPELLDALSAASTTSRSSATGTSSSAPYREYRRTHATHRKVAADEDELDGEEMDGYGRTRRHRRRHGAGKKSHRKHHHHSGRHHHHHHHHHHRHRSHHQDDYEVGGRGRTEEEEADYGHHSHHHHRSHRHRSGGTGRHSSHHHHDRPDSAHRTNDSNHDSLDNILNNELLASSHSSDRDDVSSRVDKPKAKIYSASRLKNKSPSDQRSRDEDDEARSSKQDENADVPHTIVEQTVPMELVTSTSTSGQLRDDQMVVTSQEGINENAPAEATH